MRAAWSLPLAGGARALFFEESRAPGLDGTYFFASVDARDEAIVSPVPIELWQSHSSRVWPSHFAASEQGEIAVVALLDHGGQFAESVLLLAEDGSEIGRGSLSSQSKVRTLQSTPGGDFALLLDTHVAREPPLFPERQLRFASLDRTGNFVEQSDPLGVLTGINPASTSQLLLQVDDGFIAGWDDSAGSTGGRVVFQKLNLDGDAVGAPLHLLPETEAPFQDQLSGARNGQQLALFWAEDDERYSPRNPDELSEWPRRDPNYYFMLISPKDFSARSNVLQIERAAGLDDPKLFAENGEFRVYAHSRQPAGIGATQPITVDCRPE